MGAAHFACLRRFVRLGLLAYVYVDIFATATMKVDARRRKICSVRIVRYIKLRPHPT
jgi:hypothetical protein